MANGAGNGTGGKKNGLRNGSGIATIEHSENKEKTQKEINIMSEIRKIENFAAPELDVYARLSEPQLLHYYEPQPGLFLAESPRVIERALDVGYEPVSFLAGSAELAANEALFAHCPDAPVYTAETKVLEQTHRLCPHARHALRDAPPHASGYGGNLPECPPRGDSGKCREPDECRCDFPFCRRAWHRCRAPHIRLQQPAVPPRHPREHGKCLPGPVDRAARRQLLAGAGIAALQELGFYTVAMALKRLVRWMIRR